jgi:hypothetical protein
MSKPSNFCRYGVPVSLSEANEIFYQREKNLTTPQKKPFYVNSTHFICSFLLFHIIGIINSEISKIREKYDKMHHVEIEDIDPMVHKVPEYGNQIDDLTVENVGLFRWNVQVKFLPTEEEIMFANNHNITLSEKDLIIRFTIVIYEGEDGSYIVETNRTYGDKRKLFYDFWHSLQESFKHVHALWENRKGIILLFDAVSQYEKHLSEHNELASKHDELDSKDRFNVKTHITHYLFDILVLMELCSFIGT